MNILVSPKDKYLLEKYKWHITTNGYARTYDRRIKKHILMHIMIMGIKTDRRNKQIDHINMNKLDNRRENLRIVTPSQNHMNKLANPNKSNDTKGVYWDKSLNIWKAIIGINGKNIYLGSSYNLARAIEIRNDGVKKYHKEFGRIT